MMAIQPAEDHQMAKVGWLRAAVLGANDGLLSTASLVMGVASAHGTSRSVLIAGVAGLVAGATAMAAGEYVSVHSQKDTETANLDKERAELKEDRTGELSELAAIYVARGLEPKLASEVAGQLMAHDALGAHSRDELGFSDAMLARPLEAALASAASFAVGAVLPLIVTVLTPSAYTLFSVAVTSILFLGVLGGLAARAGGAPLGPSILRVVFWGAFAMGTTAAVGAVFGTVV
jgi:vacuolar iron transporter family protein